MSRSSFTNVLDLGILMCLQAKVERMHFLKFSTTDALVDSLHIVWKSTDIDLQMTKVFDKLIVVLCNILRGNGSNDLVEGNRSVSDRKIKIDKVIRKIDKQNVNKTINLQSYDGFVDNDDDVQIPVLFKQQVE